MDAEAYMPDAETIAAIEKDIANYNQRRLHARDEVRRRKTVMLGSFAFACAVAAYFLLANFETLPDSTATVLVFVLIAVALFGGAFVYGVAEHPGVDTQQRFRDHMLPVLFGFVDNLRYSTGYEPASFSRIPDAAKGSFNHKTFDDIVTGRLDGKRFEFYEVELKIKSKSSDRTVFKGLVLNCQVVDGIGGTLVAIRRPASGLIQSIDAALKSIGDLFRSQRMEQIQSRSRLDTVYDFLTDRPDEARPLLAGRIGEVLTWVNKTWRSGNPLLAVRRNELYLLLPSSRDFFELPPLDMPLNYAAHLKPMVRDFASLLAIVAEVQKEPPPQAQEAAEAEPPPTETTTVPPVDDGFVHLLDEVEDAKPAPRDTEKPA